MGQDGSRTGSNLIKLRILQMGFAVNWLTGGAEKLSHCREGPTSSGRDWKSAIELE